MKLKKAPLLAVATLAVPLHALALGLGNVTLRSALNEPLDAEIELLSVKKGEADAIRAALAGEAEFQRAGLDRPFQLTDLRFAVSTNAAGRPLIKVTTRQPVREPFLNFLLEVNWPNGRLLREYTVLLDPPVYGARVAARVRGAETRAAAAPATQSYGAAGASAPAFSGGGTYGPTKRYDTLWSIASRVRSDASVTMQQMMLALLRANPEAFNNGNINSLKVGQVLRIPGAAEARELSQAMALAEVRRQNAAWDELRQGIAAVPRQAPATAGASRAAPPARPAGTGPEPEVELRLVSAAAGDQEAAGGSSAAELAARLSLLQEEADSKAQESAELRSRLAETESLLEDFQRLIRLKDDAIAALQARLAEASGSEATPAGEPVPEPAPDALAEPALDEGAVAEGPGLADETPEISEEPDPLARLEELLAEDAGTAGPIEEGPIEEEPMVEPMMEEVPVTPMEAEMAPESEKEISETVTPEPAGPPEMAAPEPERPRPILPPPPAPRPTGFLDSLPIGPAALGGGVGVLALIGALVAFALRRRKKAEEEVEEATAALSDTPEQAAEESAVPAGEEPVAIGGQEPDAAADEDEKTEIIQPPAAETESTSPDLDSQDKYSRTQIQSPPGAEDTLDEVNVYLAYERYDQAEQLVRKALEKYPGNEGYLLKLLEIHHASKNVSSFERDAAVLRDAAGEEGPMMAQAREWWAELSPGRDLFAAAGEGEGLDDTQTDLPAAQVGADESKTMEVEAQVIEEEEQIPEDGVDFDLGLTRDEQTAAESMVDEGSELDLDLSFELDEESDREEPSEQDKGLDFDLGEEPGKRDSNAVEESSEKSVDESDLGLDFDLGAEDEDTTPGLDAGGIDFDIGDLAEEDTSPAAVRADAAESVEGAAEPNKAKDEFEDLGFVSEAAEAEADASMAGDLDFDLGDVAAEQPAAEEKEEGLDFDLGDLGAETIEGEDTSVARGRDDDVDLELFAEGDGGESAMRTAVDKVDFDITADLDAEAAHTRSPESESAAGSLDFDLTADIGADLQDEAARTAEPKDEASGEALDLDLGAGSDADTASAGDSVEGDETTSGVAVVDFDLGFDVEEEGKSAERLEDALKSEQGGEAADFDLDLGMENEEPGRTTALDEEISGDVDEVGTKLDLAQAYIDMGDTEGARSILNEVLDEGNDEQKAEAQQYLQKMG